MSTKPQVIIDTDCGVDDAVALLFALTHEDWEVVAITCVCGNCPLEDVLRNVSHILTLVGKDVPIYRGCSSPILGDHVPPKYFTGHGKDGFGNTLDFFGPAKIHPKEGIHAVEAIIKLAREKPNHYHLIALGPLTNVALAASLDPLAVSKLKQVMIMGGAHHARGNTSLSAEFNLYSDPEAGHIVFEKVPLVEVVTWEATEESKLSWEWYNTKIKSGTSKIAKFIRSITENYAESALKHVDSGFLMCDAIAMCALLDSSSIEESFMLYCKVETTGTWTRGATLFDWYGLLKMKPNARVIKKVNHEKYTLMFESVLEKLK